jgi:hypothetical protein
MIYGSGLVSLDDITYGVLSTGIVPLGRSWGPTLWERNLAPIVMGAGETNLVVPVSLAVNTGDGAFIWATVAALKAAGAGQNVVTVKDNGSTAVYSLMANKNQLSDSDYGVVAGKASYHALATFARITTGGNLTMKLVGFSNGGTSDVGAEDAQIMIVVWKGS